MAATANQVRASARLPANIGRFIPSKLLGKGAQGVVFLATDPDLHRQVAIKTLLSRGRDQTRLLEEARNVGRLEHANIVPLYDSGVHEDNPYLVYQFVEGKSLRDLLADHQPIPAARAIPMLLKLLDAIGYAHSTGVLHRDLTPANIIIGANEEPRILDFGVSGIIGSIQTNADIVGTANYMAPENLTNGVVEAAADIFSLSVILYEMLTGTRLFTADNQMAVMYKVTHETIQPPSVVNRAIEPALDSIVMKGLERDPEQRYTRAIVMKEALEHYLFPEPVVAPKVANSSGALEFLLKRMRRKPDFPAIGQHIGELNQKTESASGSDANDVANVVLKDFALTTKLLRLVNAPTYGQYGGEISTVSRAVVILGVQHVRVAALGITLFDNLGNCEQIGELKNAASHAFLSSSIARVLAKDLGVEPEEAFVAAMFHRLGLNLTIYYFPEEYLEIDACIRTKAMKPNAAAMSVLGVSYTDLGAAIGAEWQLPEPIIKSMRAPEGGTIPPASQPDERLAQVTALANEIAGIAGATATTNFTDRLTAILERYRECFELNVPELIKVTQTAFAELEDYADILDLDLRSSNFFGNAAERFDQDDYEEFAPAESDNSADPIDAAQIAGRRAVLVDGLAEISELLVGKCEVNQVFNLVGEVLYRGMDFSHTIVCLKNGQTKSMTARFGFGDNVQALVAGMDFALTGKDSFSEAVNQARAMVLATADEIQALPPWWHEIAAARSVVLLPIAIQGTCVGLVYADKTDTELAILPSELRLLKTVCNQAALALQLHK